MKSSGSCRCFIRFRNFSIDFEWNRKVNSIRLFIFISLFSPPEIFQSRTHPCKQAKAIVFNNSTSFQFYFVFASSNLFTNSNCVRFDLSWFLQFISIRISAKAIECRKMWKRVQRNRCEQQIIENENLFNTFYRMRWR